MNKEGSPHCDNRSGTTRPCRGFRVSTRRSWNSLLMTALCLCAAVFTADAAWYNGPWRARQKITISSNITGATLSDFPVLVQITNQNNGVFTKALPNGYDIYFTASDAATKLAHEIETYTNAGTKELNAWVRIPALESNVDTTIYMYYANPASPNQQNATNVWGQDYRAVWHMAQTNAMDSTANTNNGTANGNPTLSASPKVGAAVEFDGNGDYVNLGAPASLRITNDLTVSAWFKTSDIGNYRIIISDYSSPSYSFELLKASNNRIRYACKTATTTGSVETLASPLYNDGMWHHVAAVRCETNASVYIDGEWINSANYASLNGDLLSTVTVAIGVRFYAGTLFWNGALDEIRLANTARPPAWVKAEFRTSNTPGAYLAFGLEEGPPAGTIFLIR